MPAVPGVVERDVKLCHDAREGSDLVLDAQVNAGQVEPDQSGLNKKVRVTRISVSHEGVSSPLNDGQLRKPTELTLRC